MAAIGIDLGTTNTCVAVVRGGQVEVLKNKQGDTLTPSCVAFSDVETLIGNAAKFRLTHGPLDCNVVHSVKRIIGQSFNEKVVEKQHWPFKVMKGVDGMSLIEVTRHGEKETFRPEEISALVLHEIKSCAEKKLGREAKDAVITVPARFTTLQRVETETAARIAGLNVIGMITEPTAAALAYGLSTHKQSERYVLVYDLGGGTFDVAVIKIKGTRYKMKGSDGDLYLRGDDFTNNLAESFAEKINGRKRGGPNVRIRPFWLKLRKRAEDVKKQLSFESKVPVELTNSTTGKKLSHIVDQKMLNSLNKDLYDKTIKCVEKALEKANIGKGKIKHVLLVGGSTRIPYVRNLVKRNFPDAKIYEDIDPDQIVAQGAAILAAHLSGHATKQMAQLDYVEVASGSIGTDVMGDKTSKIIEKDSKLPAVATKVFTTAMDGQESIQISVCQGENQAFSQNQLIDTFDVGIKPDLAGKVKAEVRFKLDKNGILTVTPRGKEKIEMTLFGRFRNDQIEKMTKRLQTITREKENADQHK